MPDFFGVDIAGLIAENTAGQLVAGTMTSIAVGTRPGDVTAGRTQVPTVHDVQGFFDDYKDYEIDGTTIKAGDRRIVLIGNLIKPAIVPVSNWDITLEGDTYRIVTVNRDPAAATYTCHVRGK